MQFLSSGSELQHGKYRIERVLGQGGFGITYLAENTMLEGKVAIKEFFFKEYCERGETTSCVTVPTTANREIVERFKQKFIKEARTIFRLSHPNIVRILDVFEENDTAYYVMEHIDGESLGDLVKRRGALPEQEALGYIRQAADALSYIHGERMNHLDVKPGNLMKRAKDGRVLLIDFGVAKQYDALTSEGTTTTPVGISHGYSPAEQYRKNGVQTFSPSSDVYALAATLFKLLTGTTPPEAMEVSDEGLPLDELRAKGVSESVISAIVMAMKGRNERTQSAAELVENLSKTDESTLVIPVVEPIKDTDESTKLAEETERQARKEAKRKEKEELQQRIDREIEEAGYQEATKAKSRKKIKKWIALSAIASVLIVGCIVFCNRPSSVSYSDAISVDSVLTFEAKGVSFDMVLVEGGSFNMGALPNDTLAEYYEKPIHKVTLSSYYIGRTEVTQALWKAVMGNNPSTESGLRDGPVVNVSWYDCQEFIERLNNITGEKFRLPTEAEWEYAARGGVKSKGYLYSGSNVIDEVSCSNHINDVASQMPNELGLYDMSGNAYEWCYNWNEDYSNESQTNPKGPNVGEFRVMRGFDRCTARDGFPPDAKLPYLGLRLSLSK